MTVEEKSKLHTKNSILFHSFLILCLWLAFLYINDPSLGTLFAFINVYFFIIFTALGDHIIRKYDILDRVNSQISSTFVKVFVSMSILTSWLFWAGIAGILTGFLFSFVLNHIFL